MVSSPAGSEPLVSIVIPAFNAADTLAETLASAAAQSHPATEIIIVDDGSTDSTARIAADFCARHPHARLISQDNRGVAAARNRGIAEAKGEYVAPLDADDLWHPDRIARQVAVAGPEDGFVYCWSRDIDEAGLVWRDGPRPRHTGRLFLRMLADNFVGNGSALLVRRAAAEAVGGYDESLRAQGRQGCEDILFQLRLAERYPGAVAPSYLVGYRQRAAAMSADPKAMFRSWGAARTMLSLTGSAVRRADRWSMARRRLHFAESLAWRGKWLAASPYAAAAFARDPQWGVTEIRRLLARRRERGLERSVPVLFGALDPDQAWAEPRASAAGLERLEQERHDRLAREEAELSR